MIFFVTGLAILVVLIILGRAFVAANPRSLVKALRYTVATVLIAIGVVLALGERFGLALPLIIFGISALTMGRLGPIDLGGGSRSSGTGSTVRSSFLDMHLDHDTGSMTGTVVKGNEAGKALDDLDEAALLKLAAELAVDPESVALLEAYLDRRIPGWREHFEGDATAGSGRPPDAGPMTDEEAYEVLGLLAGASNSEIRAAHRRLMKRVHPDQGGSTFLATKINEAKDRLLGKHR
jgi:hypothetical protein